MSAHTPGDEDRRHSPRIACCGAAKVISLPSNGLFLPGRMRDLSLGGCCLEAVAGLECGVRTELVVRVNAGSFRALSLVKGLRDRSGIGMEFVQLSASGKHMLADVLERLAKLQILVNQLRAPRHGVQTGAILEDHWATLKALLSRQPREDVPHNADSDSPIVQAGEIIRLDIFI